VGDSGVILASRDGGQTGTSQDSGVSDALRGVNCSGGGLCLVAGDAGVLLVGSAPAIAAAHHALAQDPE
jgi:photosystem II stability/assembly factor-like uncharacterized protein